VSIAISTDLECRLRVENFLFREAELLDTWDLNSWLRLFAPTARYTVPATDLVEPDAVHDLYLLNEDYGRIEERVNSLMGKWAHAENPVSATRRLITNVRVSPEGENVAVLANFSVHRARRGSSETYVGEYRHLLEVQADGGFRFQNRCAVLSHENLCAQGKLSIIL